MEHSLKVSILMAVKNEEKYISECIKSILSQTFSDFELLIVDDHSTDKTAHVISQFKDKRIIFSKSKGSGKNAAFNKAFKQSKGDFICLFAGDDVLHKNSLEERIKPLLKEQAQKSVSLCKLKTFSEDKRFHGIVAPKNPNLGSYTGCSYMMTRKLAEAVFPIPEDLPNEDIWIRLFVENFKVSIFHVKKVLCFYRIHGENSFARNLGFDEFNRNIMHPRFLMYFRFLSIYEKSLSEKSKNKLDILIALETLRYNGNWLSILFMKNISFLKKLGTIAYTNRFFYMLRMWGYKFFSGFGV